MIMRIGSIMMFAGGMLLTGDLLVFPFFEQVINLFKGELSFTNNECISKKGKKQVVTF